MLIPPQRTRMRESLIAPESQLELQVPTITHDPADVEVPDKHVLKIRDSRIHAGSAPASAAA
ncbi:MAG TPA: hypothetical protein VMV99_13115 [Rhodanobacter sp.]|nr:hypothetical protein [Rhodanobacter sp.]